MKKYDYFSVPIQVKFWDAPSGGHYIGGIAYQDEIICGCCGSVFKISEIYESAPNGLDNDPIIVVHGWKGISDKICGIDN